MSIFQNRSAWSSLLRTRDETRIALVAFLMFAAAAFLVPRFFSLTNISSLLVQVAPIGLVSIGMTFVIITAGVDLSVGSQVALISVLLAGNGQESLPMMLVTAIFAGVILGWINGAIVGKGHLSPFITTLSTMAIYRGAALYLSNAAEIRVEDPLFGQLSSKLLLGVPLPVWILGFAVFGGQLFLRKTVFGLRVRAVGSSAEAAHFAGVDINRVRLFVFALNGFFCALGSLIITSRLSTSTPTLGEFYELDAIAAVIIGGTSLFGGRGSVFGTLFGVLVFGIITNVLNLMGASPHIQRIAKGFVILIAVYSQSDQILAWIRGLTSQKGELKKT